MQALQYLVTRAEPVAKKDLLVFLETTRVVLPPHQAKARDQSMYGQIDTILGRLENWRFVQIAGRRRGLRIEVTSAGKGGFAMFHHLLYPRDPPIVLRV